MSNTWPELCWCCFLDIPVGEGHAGEHSVKHAEGKLIASVWVCDTCRKLGCDVPNPEGCLRPDK